MVIEDKIKLLADKFSGSKVTKCKSDGNLIIAEIDKINFKIMIKFLRDDPSFDCKMITDICGADYPNRIKRFEVIYNLLSLTKNFRILVKVALEENEEIDSICDIFSAAVWNEREIWDMYGIVFQYNPDLRRILTDYGFEGHPLRKDFPLTGYVEVRYDMEKKKVVYEPVQLMQEFRQFDFLSPWEGTDYVLPGDEKAKNK